MTRPSSVTVLPEVISTTRVLYWPSSVTSATPSLFRSPSTVMFLLINNSEVSCTVMLVPKVTMSPFCAEAKAARSEPTPVFALLVAVQVARPHWYSLIDRVDSTLALSILPVAISRSQSPPTPVRLFDAATSRPVNCASESTKLRPRSPSAV